MLRNLVQIMRSGVVGRKSLGSLPKRMVQAWFERRTDEQIFRASVGNDPSLADVMRMVHPKPLAASRAALYGYLIGQPHDAAALPEIVQQFEAFKATTVPDVPFQMLTAVGLKPEHWKQIAGNAPWQMTRMNLNAFARHGVFNDPSLTKEIAARLRNETAVSKARVFPKGRAGMEPCSAAKAADGGTRRNGWPKGRLFLQLLSPGSMKFVVGDHHRCAYTLVELEDANPESSGPSGAARPALSPGSFAWFWCRRGRC